MPEIEIRSVIASDIPALMALDHHYTSEYAWQMEMQHERENAQVSINFRQVHLPRPVRVEYPRSPRTLTTDWTRRSGILVALMEEQVIGYTSLMLEIAPLTTWATDLVVTRRIRRQGIGSALLLAAMEWALHMDTRNLVLEMQPKNDPAVQLALKMGFDFCGFNDRFYHHHETAIFFGKAL